MASYRAVVFKIKISPFAFRDSVENLNSVCLVLVSGIRTEFSGFENRSEDNYRVSIVIISLVSKKYTISRNQIDEISLSSTQSRNLRNDGRPINRPWRVLFLVNLAVLLI